MDDLEIVILSEVSQKKRNVLLYSIWNSAQCYVAAWMGGEFRGEWIHVYVWLSPFAGHLKSPQHCQSAIPHHKIKSLKSEKCDYISIKLYRDMYYLGKYISLIRHI